MRPDTLHQISPESYMTELFDFIAVKEGFGRTPYFDSPKPSAKATIGYGFNIEQVPNYMLLVLEQMGIINNTMTTAQIDAAVTACIDAINDTQHGSRYNPTLVANLNRVAGQYGVQSFSIDENQGYNVFESIILGKTIAASDGSIVIQGKQQRLDAVLQNTLDHNSCEYVAVILKRGQIYS